MTVLGTSVDRVRARMLQEARVDVLVATSYEGVAYLTGSVITTQRDIPARISAAIIPAAGEPTFVVCDIEELYVRASCRVRDIRPYVEFAQSPTRMIADVLEEKGLSRARVGLEFRALCAHYYCQLTSLLPEASFEPIDTTLDKVKALKTPEEVELLGRAALDTDEAIRFAYESAKPGMPDRQVAETFAHRLWTGRADSVAFVDLGAGPTACLAHPIPSERPMEVGDVLRCDVGGYYSGYYSDLARTAVVGKATPDQRDRYRKVWEVHEEVIAAARPGVLAKVLFFTCQRAFAKRGLELRFPHCGHSLGYGLHEQPLIEPYNDTPLEEGMTIAFEMVHTVPGGPVFQDEDLVLITREGGKPLSRSADWSEVLVVG